MISQIPHDILPVMEREKNTRKYRIFLLRVSLLTLTLFLYAGWKHATAQGGLTLFLLLVAADFRLMYVLMAMTFSAVQFSQRGVLPPYVDICLMYYLAVLASVAVFAWQHWVLNRRIHVSVRGAGSGHCALAIKFLTLLAALMLLSFNGFSPLLVAINLVLLFWVFWSTPFPPRPWTRSIRAAAATSALCIVSMVFSAALLEIGCRLFIQSPADATGLYMPDPEYIFLLKPGNHVRYNVKTSPTETIEITYDISRQGLRDREYGPKAPDEFRILLLGDSFTMGHAVPVEDTISRQLEQLLARERLAKRITVINGGINAAGPLQERGMLMKRGLALQPDIVLLQCFLLNDIDDCMNSIGKSLRAYVPYSHKTINLFRRQNELPCRVDRWFMEHSRAYATVTYLLDSPGMIARLLSQCRFFPPLPKLVLQAPEEWALSLDVNRREVYPELTEGWGVFEEHLRILNNECRKRGIDFAVYCVPGHEEVSRALWDAAAGPHGGPACFERFLAIRKTMSFLAQENIPNINILDALLQYEPRILDVYYPEDGHTTPLGNRVIAQSLREYLCEGYFPAKGLLP